MFTTLANIFSFFCGLGSSLFIETPFGRAALFDLLCYVVGPIFYVKSFYKFSKAEQNFLLLAFLWCVGAIWSNWWRQEAFDIALKGNAIIFNFWCMLVVGIRLIKKDHRTFMWFMVGNGISCVISLYYFQNGALLTFAERAGFLGEGGLQEFLAEKQIYPIYFNLILKSVLFPLVAVFNFPWLPVVLVLIMSAFFLLFNGGSRSSFGINLLSSFFIVGYAYFRRAAKIILNHFVLVVSASIVAALIVFSIYKNLALSGALGDQEFEKYEREMILSEAGMFGSRDDIIRAWPFLKEHPIVGAGSSGIDRWGYMVDDFKLPAHSVIVGSWVQNGFFGLVFWGNALFLIAYFIQHRVIRFTGYAPFIVINSVYLIWNILFSPFGLFRGEAAFLLSLCIASKDVNWLSNVENSLSKGSRTLSRGRYDSSKQNIKS